jgi:hypothetical protein
MLVVAAGMCCRMVLSAPRRQAVAEKVPSYIAEGRVALFRDPPFRQLLQRL